MIIWILIGAVLCLVVGYLVFENQIRQRDIDTLYTLRDRLEEVFAPDTAHPSTTDHESSSSGHCAAVAVIVHCMFGGRMCKVFYRNQSHWFNEIEIAGETYRVDLTGDQFGFVPVRICKVGRSRLFSGKLEIRTLDDVDEETKDRAALLAARAGLENVRSQIESEI